MKIRTQLNLLIFFMVVIPIICFLSLPVYHYLSSPQRKLYKDFKAIRRMNAINLPEDDWQMLSEQLKLVPPHIQVLVYHDGRVIISSLPELPANTLISPLELFDFMGRTNDFFDYQLRSPSLVADQFPMVRDSRFLIIFRSKVPEHNKRPPRNFYTPAFIGLSCFEIFCIFFLIHLSHVIAVSITFLEQSALKIAGGELDTKVESHISKRDPNEITKLAEGLVKMRDSLKDAQERRTKFIMGISHDLRTPVALIKGYTEAITDGVVDDMDEIKKSLSIIYAKADQLESMINDLINYVKLNNTDWRQTLENVPLKPVLSEFAESSKVTAELYKRSIETSISISDTAKVPMDKQLFTRALENIFSNALRYTKENDGIQLSAWEEGKNACIRISDTGAGISEKDLKHIYDLFYRGSNSRREAGMGIGLSVVKTIIDTHGWHIDVKSELGKGTEFIITMQEM